MAVLVRRELNYVDTRPTHTSIMTVWSEVFSGMTPFRMSKSLPQVVEERSLVWDAASLADLLDGLATNRIVLLGEASHGTREFYRERAKITQHLIRELGFDAVAAEADWPDAYRIGCFVRGSVDEDIYETLAVFDRFPRWMWANEVVAEFACWLRDHNAALDPKTQVAFYGLDLYSLRRSMRSVLDYLQKIDADAADRAKRRYDCFDRFGDDPSGYAYGAFGSETCEEEVVEQLVELQQTLADAPSDGPADDGAFFAKQNALVVKNAEEYYRSMFRGGVHTWNLRDTHMFETLRALDDHLSSSLERPAKIALWAHNSHLGDARATSMARRGELNLGQLVREHYGEESTNVGFTTFAGSVRAADDWDGRDEVKDVQPALDGSYEALLHEVGGDRLVHLRDPAVAEALRGPLLQRAIGVIYRPQTERVSHYFEARLPDQFDWLIHLDETAAIEPLRRPPADEDEADLPETYPSGV